MESQDRAQKDAENPGLLWALAYFLLAVALLAHASHGWEALHSQPFSWISASDLGLRLLLLPIPLTMGLGFRRTLKNERRKDMLTERTCRICDSWMPQLLIMAYLCLVVIQT